MWQFQPASRPIFSAKTRLRSSFSLLKWTKRMQAFSSRSINRTTSVRVCNGHRAYGAGQPGSGGDLILERDHAQEDVLGEQCFRCIGALRIRPAPGLVGHELEALATHVAPTSKLGVSCKPWFG